MKQKTGKWGFVVIWEFRLRAGMESRFERAYGPDGEWAQFFKKDQAYIRTELIRDLNASGTYLTLDFWRSQEAYEAFRDQNSAEYKSIDAKYEAMTESEREIGRYVRTGSTT